MQYGYDLLLSNDHVHDIVPATMVSTAQDGDVTIQTGHCGMLSLHRSNSPVH